MIHLGTADSGHYYSLISESKQEEKWLEFNDIHVRRFDVNDLASEAFGGDEKNLTNSMMNTLSKSMKERSKNAYLLFYERSKNFDENGVELTQLAVPENSDSVPRFFNEIKEDNVKYYINKNCFDNEFSLFIQKILTKTVETNRFTDPLSLDVYKLGFLYFFAVVIRFKDREKLIPSLTKLLKKALSSNAELANWFLMNASHEETIRETLIESPLKDIKYIISGFYVEAIKKLVDEKTESAVRMLDMCLYLLLECKERKIMDVFYRILIAYARGSKFYKQYLLEKKALSLLYYYIMELQIPSEFNYPKPQPLEVNELGGLVKQKSNINIRSIEEIVEKKKEKSYLENMTVNYSNLIVAFSFLACSMPLNEITKTKTPTILEPIVDYKIEGEERKMLCSASFWRQLWKEGQAKICWKHLARFFCHLSINNKSISVEVIKAGFEDLNACDENPKVYLKMFESLMILDDEIRNSRLKYITEKMITVFKENSKCYRFSNTMMDYFFKMCGRHASILKAFSEFLSDKQTYRFLEEWIKSLRELPYQLTSGNYTIYKKKKANLNINQLQLSKFYKGEEVKRVF